MSERFNLENQLFTWEEWDDFGTMSPVFYNVELLVPIGPFPVGSKFPGASLIGDKSLLQLNDPEEDGKSYTFELILSVGKQLTTEEADACFNKKNDCKCGHSHD